ncbi:15641_t:CDS:2, partial [Gigaspora margarita]
KTSFNIEYNGMLARISTELEIVEIEAEYIQVSIELVLDLESLELRLDTRIGSHNHSELGMVVELFWIYWEFENFGL